MIDPVQVQIIPPIPVLPIVPQVIPIPQLQQVQAKDPSVPARTTFQEDLTTASQRRINLIWEYTQAIIALLVVFSTMVTGAYASFTHAQDQLPTIMSVAFGTVVGFYFSRTNHAAIGGVGAKPEAPYEGR